MRELHAMGSSADVMREDADEEHSRQVRGTQAQPSGFRGEHVGCKAEGWAAVPGSPQQSTNNRGRGMARCQNEDRAQGEGTSTPNDSDSPDNHFVYTFLEEKN